MLLLSSTQTARVYIDVKADSLPAHPGNEWARFVCISDTHSKEYVVPPGDVLLHAGDLSSWGYPKQLQNTLKWLSSLNHSVKVIVAGNHDLCLDSNLPEDIVLDKDPEEIKRIRSYMKSEELINANIYYLEHEPIDIVTSGRIWKVYGSPSARQYARGSFQYNNPEKAKSIYDKIPDDTEILLTHTPPYMVLDETRRGKHAGCEFLSERMKELESCKLHVFGHIHEASGAQISQHSGGSEFVQVNAAVAWGSLPIVVDLMK